jgi:hypothetical protein
VPASPDTSAFLSFSSPFPSHQRLVCGTCSGVQGPVSGQPAAAAAASCADKRKKVCGPYVWHRCLGG